ncbi:hypothetical protein F2Q69_00021489 [Brassica cretica]|uniref:Uncharacterized protein n=1 Tax=Brassica cretica TaxID=69181 RepID=A0A8S9Q995_BRACR|nr:hypothetical protein F2Q69_00021489 [Brassica cretica]
MSSYEAFTLLKPPPKTHLKLHWRTHILSVPQLHVKNLILQEKRLVHFPQSSGMVMIVRKPSIPRKTITTELSETFVRHVQFPLAFEDAKFYYIAAFSPSMYHQTPYSRHMNMLLQTPRDKQDSCLNQVHAVCFGMRLRQESAGFTAGRQYKTTLVITQVADHVVFATDGKVEKYPVIHLPRRSGFNRLWSQN